MWRFVEVGHLGMYSDLIHLESEFWPTDRNGQRNLTCNHPNMNYMCPRCVEPGLELKYDGLQEMAILGMNSKLFHL